MYNNFFEEQQKYFNGVAENYKEFSEKMMKNFPMQDFYKPYMEGLGKMTNMWQPNFNFTDFYSFYNSQIPGMDIYKKVFEFWQGMSDPKEFLSTYPSKCNDLVQDVFSKIVPENARSFFDKPNEVLKKCIEYYNKFMSPWFNIDNSVITRICSGDIKAYVDFFKEVNAKYDESFGKMFNVMGIGLNRENFEEQMQLYSGYNKLMFSSAELIAMVTDTLHDAMKDIFKKYNQMLSEGGDAKSFKDFYSVWYKSNEDTMLELFNTDEFSKVYADFSDQYSKYMIMTNKAYEKMLSFLPIPTKTDMDSLYKTVYDLRKEVHTLKKEIEKSK